MTNQIQAKLFEDERGLGEASGRVDGPLAGAASFRRSATLEECLEQAREQVERFKRQAEDDPGAASRRQQAARERAARERQERIEQALKRLPKMAEIEAKQGKSREQARVSTTDAQATVMKMADGGRMRQRPSPRTRPDAPAGTRDGQVRGILLLNALAHNLMRTLALAPHLLRYGRGAPAETAMAT
jgi:hypothetical protein